MTSSDTTPPESEETVPAASEAAPAKKAATRKAPAKKAATKKTAAKKTTAKKVAAKSVAAEDDASVGEDVLVDAAAPTESVADTTAPGAAAVDLPGADTEPRAEAAPEPIKAPAATRPEPAADAAEAQAEEQAQPEGQVEPEAGAAAEAPAPWARVIVAEDEALIRLDLVELLRDEGYDVVAEVGDGEAAVEKARELKPDLVVMDVQMPRMDGISAAKIIAEERIAPVVMLTAFSQRELVEGAREAGAMAYVVKPFEASDVVPAIEMAIARFQEIRAVEAEVEDLEERLASRKAVDQAKGLLQSGMGMNEQEAFRWIQKTAMDLRKPMREVAEGIIAHAKKPKNQ